MPFPRSRFRCSMTMALLNDGAGKLRCTLSYARRDGAELAQPLATFTSDAATYGCAFAADSRLFAGDALGRVHFLRLDESKRQKVPV